MKNQDDLKTILKEIVSDLEGIRSSIATRLPASKRSQDSVIELNRVAYKELRKRIDALQ